MASKFRSLLLALLLSLALHCSLFAAPFLWAGILSFSPRTPSAVGPMLQLRLVAREVPKPLSPIDHANKTTASAKTESAIPIRNAPDAMDASLPSRLESANPDIAAPAGAGNSKPSEANSAPQPPTPADQPSGVRTSAPGGRQLPQQGELTYKLYWSRDHWLVGQAHHQWATDTQGRYSLYSETKTTGLFALLQPLSILDESRGLLTEQGMTPLRYVTRFNEEPPAEVHFDRPRNQVSFYYGAMHKASLFYDMKVFDKLSFMYQLALMQPKEPPFSIMITLGYRVENYVIESVGTDELDTGLGTVSAIHLRRTNIGTNDDHVEVWLAPAYDYLPVKILFFNDSQGQYYEQTIDSFHYGPG